jgi:hypothetical protein
MDTPKSRTEDDLRAAFALAAQDAPSGAEVLAKVRAAQHGARPVPTRSRARGRWAPLAAVAAILIVVGVPVALIARSDSSNRASSSSGAGGANADVKAAAPEHAASGGATGDAAAESSSAAAGGPGVVVPGPGVSTPTVYPSAGRTCTPSDVTLTLRWQHDGTSLGGLLQATNHTSAACDLAVKPAIYPVGSDGNRLAVLDAVSAEGYVGPTRLLPGATTSSTLSWTGWCGPAASTTAQVDWGAGVATVTVSGPTTPSCVPNGATNISSTWFTPLS